MATEPLGHRIGDAAQCHRVVSEGRGTQVRVGADQPSGTPEAISHLVRRGGKSFDGSLVECFDTGDGDVLRCRGRQPGVQVDIQVRVVSEDGFLLRREAAEERAGRHPGPTRDLVDRRRGAPLLLEQVERGAGDLELGVSATSLSQIGRSFGHPRHSFVFSLSTYQ